MIARAAAGDRPTSRKPASAPVAFTAEDESLSAKFRVTAPPRAKSGAYALRAVVTSEGTGAQKFSVGYQEIDYPHIQRRQVIKAAETTAKVLDVRTAPNLSGYWQAVFLLRWMHLLRVKFA